MSSNINATYLSSDDLNLLQGVLSRAGYTADLLIESPETFNVAAILLIKLFQDGVTEPRDLTIALERHFGRVRTKPVALPAMPRYAIQGIPTAGRAGH